MATAVVAAPARTSRRCRSWRPVESSTHRPVHAPGACRGCWRPCFRKVAEGRRCAACTTALAGNLDPTVRRMLAAEPAVPATVLRVLAGDLNAVVASAAKWQLDRLEPAPNADHAEPGWAAAEHQRTAPIHHGPADPDDEWN